MENSSLRTAKNRNIGTYSLIGKGYTDDYEKIGEHKVLAGVNKEKKKEHNSEKFKECLLQNNFSKGYLAGPAITSAYLRNLNITR